MEYLKIIVLAIVQGLTEFLPVSSSGHLVISEYLLGVESPGVLLEVFLHLGTFVSVLIVFWKDIVKIILAVFGNFWKFKQYPRLMKENDNFAMGIFILVSMVPAALAGYYLESRIEGFFDNIILVGVALLVTGVILFLTQWAQNEKKPLTVWRAFIMGLAQALAIIPGISRSGSTIATGMFLGMPKDKIAKFSFLMALPVIFGAAIFQVAGVSAETVGFTWQQILVGTFTSFLFGYIAIKWLLSAIVKGKFYVFGFYCLIIGFITIIMG